MEYYKRIQDAIDFIEENLTEKIEIHKVSEKAHFSPFYFQRLFRMISGFSVYEYIMKRRLSEACKLLNGTDLSILEIAISFDYSSHEAFSRAFCKYFGINPSEYRKNSQIKVEFTDKLIINHFVGAFPDYKFDEPVIRQMKKKIIYGYSYKTNLDSDKYFNDIPGFYGDFGENTHFMKIPERVCPAISYGIPFDYKANGEFSFLVGEETGITSNVSENSFAILELPEGEYAEFSINGSVEECQKAWRYIFSIWLPKSDYNKADSPDYEMTDVCGSCYPEKMKMKIVVPLIRKKTNYGV